MTIFYIATTATATVSKNIFYSLKKGQRLEKDMQT